jgi:hypothetical protein
VRRDAADCRTGGLSRERPTMPRLLDRGSLAAARAD